MIRQQIWNLWLVNSRIQRFGLCVLYGSKFTLNTYQHSAKRISKTLDCHALSFMRICFTTSYFELPATTSPPTYIATSRTSLNRTLTFSLERSSPSPLCTARGSSHKSSGTILCKAEKLHAADDWTRLGRYPCTPAGALWRPSSSILARDDDIHRNVCIFRAHQSEGRSFVAEREIPLEWTPSAGVANHVIRRRHPTFDPHFVGNGWGPMVPSALFESQSRCYKCKKVHTRISGGIVPSHSDSLTTGATSNYD